MANRENKALGRPFQVFLGGAYSSLVGGICKFCADAGCFYGKDLEALKSGGVVCLAIAGGCTLYYLKTRSKLDDVFLNLGIGYNDRYPMKKSVRRTENSIIYTFRIPAGVCLKDFEDNKQAIENFLGHKVDIRYTYKAIEIEEFILPDKTFYEYEKVDKRGHVVIVIGYTRNGKLITCDLSHGEPHLLIAGETGSGKSTVLRSIIVNLLLTSNVQLHLVDLKNGTEFRMFEKCSNVISFARNTTMAITVLESLVHEVDRRYDLFYKYDVKDIDEYNSSFQERLNYEVLIMDEFADLQDNKKAKALIDELGRKARACGIYMILATQRPDSKVLDGNIKANVTNILGLKTLNATNSNIIIGEKGLEELRGKGHGIFKRGGKQDYIQAPFLDADKARSMIKHLYVKKERKEEESKSVDYIMDDSFLDELC